MFLDFFKKLFQRPEPRKLTKSQVQHLESLIGHKISNHQYYIESLTHRSAVDKKTLKTSNERLEFLGDAVLGFIVAEHLFSTFPSVHEGELTKMRANLVNKNTLFEAAKEIDLFSILIINKDLLTSENFGYKTILADAFEALVGAVYMDCGTPITTTFVKAFVIDPNLKTGRHLADENYKSQLLEYVQSRRMEMPKYILVGESGPEHDRSFTMQVVVGERVLGQGAGKNKKSAEQEAAKAALRALQSDIEAN